MYSVLENMKVNKTAKMGENILLAPEIKTKNFPP